MWQERSLITPRIHNGTYVNVYNLMYMYSFFPSSQIGMPCICVLYIPMYVCMCVCVYKVRGGRWTFNKMKSRLWSAVTLISLMPVFISTHDAATPDFFFFILVLVGFFYVVEGNRSLTLASHLSIHPSIQPKINNNNERWKKKGYERKEGNLIHIL